MASRVPVATLIVACLWLALPATGLGQGNGNGNGRPKGPRLNPPGSPSPTPASSPATAPSSSLLSGTTFRQFGAWLDDTSAPRPGEGQTTIGVGHWRMQGLTQTNLPMLGVNVGVTDRLQVSALLPFYRVSYAGSVARGVDDVYLSAKYTLVDPTLTLSEVGVAVSPVVEVLTADATDRRVHFAIPVSVEVRRQPFRVYGSAGYFTRGSVFTGGALEWTSPARLTLTGALTQSYSVKADPALDALGIGANRADLTGSLAYPIGQAALGYVSVGRSLTSVEDGGTTLSVSGGVAVRFNGGTPHRP